MKQLSRNTACANVYDNFDDDVTVYEGGGQIQ